MAVQPCFRFDIVGVFFCRVSRIEMAESVRARVDSDAPLACPDSHMGSCLPVWHVFRYFRAVLSCRAVRRCVWPTGGIMAIGLGQMAKRRMMAMVALVGQAGLSGMRPTAVPGMGEVPDIVNPVPPGSARSASVVVGSGYPRRCACGSRKLSRLRSICIAWRCLWSPPPPVPSGPGEVDGGSAVVRP